MLLLITAAGEGNRFRKIGIETPKPLIQVNGKSLLEHTLSSFKLTTSDQILIAVQRYQNVPDQLDHLLRKSFPQVDMNWIELETLLPGQLSTAVVALEKNSSEKNQSLMIHNCDTGFQWQNDLVAEAPAYGSMAVFPANGDHWSFGKPDPLCPNRAIAIAEKRRISNLASIGLYGFQSIELFLHDAQKQLKSSETVNGEYYIAPMLQQAINQGKIIQLPRVTGVRTYGTPEELCANFKIDLNTLKANNP